MDTTLSETWVMKYKVCYGVAVSTKDCLLNPTGRYKLNVNQHGKVFMYVEHDGEEGIEWVPEDMIGFFCPEQEFIFDCKEHRNG